MTLVIKSKNEYNKLDVHSEDVFRLFEKNKRKASIAKAALNNKIEPFPGFDVTEFNSEIWKVKKSEKYGNSYTLYIHSLRVTVELMLAYEATKEEKYFNKAEEIILSWIEYSKLDDDNKMIWYDHTTANRVQVLIHYLYLANGLDRKINIKVFKGILENHAEVMIDDAIYKHNNHGLMMDRSLIILGYILNDDHLFTKGKTRAINTFWYSFSSQGIHLENSPQYHSMVVRMYTEIEQYLNKKEDSLGDHVPQYLNISRDYIPIITKPDNYQPSIGDSSETKQSRHKVYENICDIEAGISVMQYEKPYKFYTTFIAGYSSKVHKHKDDLSITLNYKSKDFLVDPGKYSYTSNDTRRYITSKEAHNSFYLKDFDYTIKDENRYTRNIKLENHYENQHYTLVSGIHSDYDGSHAKLTRTVIQFKKYPMIVMVDRVISKAKHHIKLEQNFNLASDVSVTEYQNKYKLISGDEEMTIQQFLPSFRSAIIEGDIDTPQAVNTAGFAKVKKTKQIKFNRATKQSNAFITGIFDERVIDDINIGILENTLEVTLKDKKIYIYL